jgi:glycolate oxidase FAD binding subunit
MEQVFPFVLALREAQLDPASIAVRMNGEDVIVDVVFEGFGPGVDAQIAACENVAHGVTLSVASAVEGPTKYSLKATFPPTEFERVAREIQGEALAFPSLGVMHFGCPEGDAVPRAQALRDLLEPLGGTLVVQDMPNEWRGKIDAWGTPPPAFKLMRALKDRFDPERRLNPGRFVGAL